MNRVFLTGHVGNISRHGNQVFLRLATKSLVKDDDGKFESVTTWHDVVAHKKQAENIERTVGVGDIVTLDCHLSYREVVQQEIKQTRTFVNIDSFDILHRKAKESAA